MEQKEEKKKIKKGRVIIIGIITLIIVAYAIYTVAKLIKNPTNTFVVSQGDVSKEETQTGYIVRDEQVIDNDSKKSIVKIKQEGERVAKGDSVFKYELSGEEDLEKSISDLDIKIQDALSNNDNTFSSDKKLLETQIESELDNIYKDNNMQSVQEEKKKIDTYITKKAKIVGDLSPAGSYVKKLIDERTNDENELDSKSEYVLAPESGMVSYKVDGLEKTLTPSNFQNLNKDFLNKLNINVGQSIANSDTQGKIINNYDCYMIFNSNSAEAKAAKVNDSITIRLQDNSEVGATITNIIDESDGSKTIAIKIKENIDSLIGYRKITFDIIWWKASGFKIPNSSITKINDVTYVVRNRNGYLDKMAVKILKQNDQYSIVEGYNRSELLSLGLTSDDISNLKTLTLYDQILLKP